MLRLNLLLGIEKRLGIVQNPLPDLRRGVAPCGVECGGLPAREAMRPKRIRHALRILSAGIDSDDWADSSASARIFRFSSPGMGRLWFATTSTYLLRQSAGVVQGQEGRSVVVDAHGGD